MNSNTRVIGEKLLSPKNMDGELSWEEEQVLYEPGGWEKREKDWALFEQLDLLFKANKYLPHCEEHKAMLQRRISEVRMGNTNNSLIHDTYMHCTFSDAQIHKIQLVILRHKSGKYRGYVIGN